jgi:DNA-binding winged helix-turn-helix (wHTH) protein/tetratricopeptide (TPR) repeat protein
LTASTSDCEIIKDKGELIFNGKLALLRPKTFELLLLLASKPGQVFSKEDILTTIWQNSVVEDQVIFQSINEIRKELGQTDVIKTYPRRGYSWEVPNTTLLPNEKAHQQSPQSPIFFQIKLRAWVVFISITMLMTIFIAVSKNKPPLIQIEETLSQQQEREEQAESHNGILVLPFNVESLELSRKWLRYGAMEGVINRITPNNDYTVFHLEDVIEIMNRLPNNSKHAKDDMSMLFEKSGASHILQTSLSGVPGELNAVYTLYSRQSRVTKAINKQSLEAVLSHLVGELGQMFTNNIQLNTNQTNNQLQNDLIAKSFQFLEVNDHKSALAFIQSAAINEPDSLLAQYLLSKVALDASQPEISLRAIAQAEALNAKKARKEYAPRLIFFKGVVFLSSGKITEAETIFQQAATSAKQAKDWLYYAYSQSYLGKIKQHQQQFNEAQNLFNSALEYQQHLQCPMGVAQGYLDLTELFIRSGKLTEAQSQFNKAQTLVNERNLKQVIPFIEETEKLLHAAKKNANNH